MKYSAILIVALSAIPYSAAAMSVEDYRKTLVDARSSRAEVRLRAESTLYGYFHGMSETFRLMRNKEKVAFRYHGETPAEICIPESVTLNSALIRLATDGEINDHKDRYVLNIGQDWETYGLSTFSVYGLQRMFPCGTP